MWSVLLPAHKMAAPGQTLLDEVPLLPRLLLCELYVLEQSIQVHFSLLVESVSSPALAVFVEGWLIKAGMPWRKVRLGPATALPSGPCGPARPSFCPLASACGGSGKKPQTPEGSSSGRWDTAEEEEVTEWAARSGA